MSNQWISLTRELLDAGADPDARGVQLIRFADRTPEGKPILRGPRTPIGQFQSFTPLTAAIEAGNEELIRLLIAAGADLHLDEPLILAIRQRFTAAVEALLEAGVNPVEAVDRSLSRKGIDAVTLVNQMSVPVELARLVNSAARRYQT